MDTRRKPRCVAENALSAKCDDFRNDSHTGQDHDVDGRVGIEPKHMLEKNRIATKLRAEE